MPHPPTTRIRHHPQVFAQVNHPTVITKSRTDTTGAGRSIQYINGQARFNSGHGSLTRSWDLDTHMINKSRAALHPG